MIKLLIGSPVRQKPQILEQFLAGIEDADKEGIAVSCYFVDDNTDPASSHILQNFARGHDCLVRTSTELLAAILSDSYASDEETHTWDKSAIEKISRFKDAIIEYAIREAFDYLLFIDSDIVIDRRMIRHLLSRQVEIVSNVFWTQWKPNWEPEPQCFWIPAPEAQVKRPFSNPMSAEEARQLRKDFFTKMRVPGIYPVDGLGACTLIHRSALEKGVRFRTIPNLAMLGEDRHFCIRAGALDIRLWMDTVYPAYHIFRESYLDRVEEFKRDGFKFDMCQTWSAPSVPPRDGKILGRLRRTAKRGTAFSKRLLHRVFRKKPKPLPSFSRRPGPQRLTLLLYVDTARAKYLRQTLEATRGLADSCVIFDATGDSNSAQLAAAYYAADALCILSNNENSELNVRSVFCRLWQEAARFHPDWVLSLFAGELPEASAGFALPFLLPNQFADVYFFRRYDLWDADHYREEPGWELHKEACPVLMRYRSDYAFDWQADKPLSVRLPAEAARLRRASTELKLASLRWADPKDRLAPYPGGEAEDVPDPAVAELRRTSLAAAAPVLQRWDLLPPAFQPLDD